MFSLSDTPSHKLERYNHSLNIVLDYQIHPHIN